jgi:hypothetical protein
MRPIVKSLISICLETAVLWVGTACLVCAQDGDPNIKDSSWRERLLSEAPDEWRSLENKYLQVEGEFTVYETEIDRPPHSELHRIQVNSKLRKLISFKNDIEIVECVNPDYAFRVSRPYSKEAKVSETASIALPYAIGFLERSDFPLGGFQEYVGRLDMRVRDDVCGPCYLFGKSMRDRIKSTEFQIKQVTPVKDEGHEWVRVDYDWVPAANDDVRQRESTAHVTLDPANHWIVREYEIGLQSATVRATLEYGDEIGDPPRYKKRREVMSGDKWENGGPWEVSRTVDFQRLENRTVPEGEFKLSFYGLPEPDLSTLGTTGRLSYTFWVFFILGIVACFAGLLIRRKIIGEGMQKI